MTLLFSDHAKKRMFERGIAVEEVKTIIRHGRKWKEDSLIHASMRNVEVIYKTYGSDTFVITVHYK